MRKGLHLLADLVAFPPLAWSNRRGAGPGHLALGLLLVFAPGCGEPAPERAAPAPAPVTAEVIPALPDGPVGITPAFPGLESLRLPAAMVQAPGDPEHWYVIEQEGRVRRFRDDPAARVAPVLLDISERVVGPDRDWEAGLVGLAFHPRFPDDPRVFLYYTAPSEASPVGCQARLSSFRFSPESAAIDPASEQELLSIECRHVSYNGGTLVFGPDGYLYVASGQNIVSEARPHPSQDTFRLEGKILRIDVDGPPPYGIPPDNPFARGGGAPEVFAYGFRNPWKIVFDAETGRLFAGDVGHVRFEEINVVEAGRNYGWPDVEGDECREDCPPGYAPPIHAYAGPGAAVIAGGVYRGAAIPELRGAFVFADFMRAEVWTLRLESGAWRAERLMKADAVLRARKPIGSITTFATDADGELYAVTRGGRIVRFVPRAEMVRYYSESILR